MTLADDIRVFTYEKYIKPARDEGRDTVTIRAGDVHDVMDLVSKMPSVCGAIGTNKFLKQYNLSSRAVTNVKNYNRQSGKPAVCIVMDRK